MIRARCRRFPPMRPIGCCSNCGQSTNSTPFVSKSVFLGQEGYLLSDGRRDGTHAGSLHGDLLRGGQTSQPSGGHVGRIRCPSPINLSPTISRRTPTRYYGGTNGAVQLESNAWGMIAGDADGDGEILAVDALLYDTQTNSTGYKRADFNLDGVVSNDDRDVFWSNNMGRCTAMAQGETILKPALKIQPARKTLLAESTNIFSASGGTGTITWAFVKNPSGGTTFLPLPHLDGLSGGNHFLVYRRAGGLGSRGSTGPGVCQCHQLERDGAGGEGHHRGGTQERERSALADHGLSGGPGLQHPALPGLWQGRISSTSIP